MSSQAALRKFRLAACGADLLADPIAGFVYPQIESAEVSGAPKYYPRDVLAQDLDKFPGILGEMEGAGLKFALSLRGFGGAVPGAGSGVIASDGENGLLLKSCFGTQQKDTGSLTTAGTTASLMKVADTALFTVGGLIGLVDAATGKYHARQVRSKTATDLVLDRDLPFVPAIGATVYASAHYSHAVEGHQHLWFDVEGYQATTASNWRRYIRGALGDVKFKLEQRATMEFDFKAIDLAVKDGTTMGAVAYPANLPVGGMAVNRLTRVFLGANALKVTAIGYEPGLELQPKVALDSPSGTDKFFVRGRKDAITITAYQDDGAAAIAQAIQARAGYVYDFLAELTQGGPGNAAALVAPFVEFTGYKMVSVNGLDAYQFEAQVLRNDTIAGVPALTLALL